MNKLKKNLCMWMWQFPQNLLAVCIEGILCNSAKRGEQYDGNISILCTVFPSSMSLGKYIFIHPYSSMKTIKHECGHSRQSRMIGPLYLIVVAIPSIIHRIVWGICKKMNIHWDYNKFPTESWAEKLAKRIHFPSYRSTVLNKKEIL